MVMAKDSFIKLPRKFFEGEKELKDYEWRMYITLARQAPWDTRKEAYGQVHMTITEIAELCGCSRGKVSEVINKLRQKGWLKRLKDKTLVVEKFEQFTRSYLNNERNVRRNEQYIQYPEHNVRESEQIPNLAGQAKYKRMKREYGFEDKAVHKYERPPR